MNRASVFAALLCVIAIGCSSNRDLSRPATQDDFGVQMAKQNLWREAMFRFERAISLNPSDALAHNNLAVAYEANGDSEKARKEYLEALKLDKSNQYIQKNYSRYVEFLSRNKKRLGAAGSSSTAPKTGPSAPIPPVPAGPSTAQPILPGADQPKPPDLLSPRPHGGAE